MFFEKKLKSDQPKHVIYFQRFLKQYDEQNRELNRQVLHKVRNIERNGGKQSRSTASTELILQLRNSSARKSSPNTTWQKNLTNQQIQSSLQKGLKTPIIRKIISSSESQLREQVMLVNPISTSARLPALQAARRLHSIRPSPQITPTRSFSHINSTPTPVRTQPLALLLPLQANSSGLTTGHPKNDSWR